MDTSSAKDSFVMQAFENLNACVWRAAPKSRGIELDGPVPPELSELAEVGERWLQWVFPCDQARVAEWFSSRGKAGVLSPIDYRLVTEAHGIVWVRQWLHREGEVSSPAKTKGVSRRPVHLRGLIAVISPLKQLEGECLRVCERERTSIGQELHDDICQLMAGLSCMLDVLGRQISKVRPDLHVQLDELSSQIHHGMERTRVLAHGLIPAKLLTMGLGRALAELARQTEVARQIKVVLEVADKIPDHSPEQTLHLYRIAQEAVSNAIKHGRATEITLGLKRGRGRMVLFIRDNGCGMAAQTSDRPQGIGMHVMQFRAAILGSSLAIRSSRGKGVLVEVPYSCSLDRTQGIAKSL